MKRSREDDDETFENSASQHNSSAAISNKRQEVDDLEDDNEPVLKPGRRGSAVRKGHECPYLDTVSRQVCI